MKPHDIRLKKLRQIIDERFGGKTGPFADHIEKKRPQIYRLFSTKKNRRGIGEALAREIELKLNLPKGWLDSEDYSTSRAQPHTIASISEKLPYLPRAQVDAIYELIKDLVVPERRLDDHSSQYAGPERRSKPAQPVSRLPGQILPGDHQRKKEKKRA